MQKIIIFNVNWLGDVICSTPAIRAIKRFYPDSYLACLVVPRCRQVLEANPHIDEVIDFDEKGSHRGLVGKLQLIGYLRSKRFDKAFILHRSFSRALMLTLAGIPWRVGYNTKKRGWLLSCSLEEPQQPAHKVDYFLNLVKATASHFVDGEFRELDEQDYEFVISPGMLDRAGRILKEEGLRPSSKFALLNPGGNWLLKRWPVDNFARLGDLIVEKTGMPVVITGAEKDLTLAQEIAKQMKTKPVITCGQTDIKSLAGLLKLSSVVVTGDTGPMHLAVAVGSRVIALFGPTSPQLTGPRGRGNYTLIHKDIGCEVPCYNYSCKVNRCMQAIKPEEVMKVIINQKCNSLGRK